MKLSPNGVKLLHGSEACRLTAYQDVKGVWTIGWGHIGPSVCKGLTWTQAQADAQFAIDVSGAEHSVNAGVSAPISQNQFDALVDFTFNVGSGAFSGSTLLRLLNHRDYEGASEQFLVCANALRSSPHWTLTSAGGLVWPLLVIVTAT